MLALAFTVGCAATPPMPSPVVRGASAAASGWAHTCAVTTDGRVHCWGNNQDGQLGDGTRETRATPHTVVGLLGSARSVTVGERHSCILAAGGGVKCWGSNQAAQLGDGTRVDRVTPTEVRGLSGGVRMVAAGERHTCALLSGGGVRCWGSNRHGQLGDGTYEDRSSAVPVSDLGAGVKAIAAGWRHTCALMEDGGVRCWGANNDGQLGDRTGVEKLIPVEVHGLDSGGTMIAAGGRHTCAVVSTGGVKCWGYNERGQLGNRTLDSVSVPTFVPDVTNVGAISTGWQHTCVLAGAGSIVCWGNNEKGQVSAGGDLARTRPVAVSPSPGFGFALAAGGHHTCAIVREGDVRCWGDNEYGQLGTGSPAGPGKM